LSKRSLAIIVAVNTKQFSGYPEQADRANIELHQRHIRNTGAVYWCVPAPGYGTPSWLNNVRVGYFSQGMHNVTHRFDIISIRQWRNLSKEEKETEEEYVVGSRINMWRDPAYYGSGTEIKGLSMIWIKIREISGLSQPRRWDEFTKALTNRGKPLGFVRSYAIVFDPGFH
jgi:hypothetical protein